MKKTPSHFEYRNGGKIRVFDDPADSNRGDRCPICYWALYDGDWCQNPRCQNRGGSVENPIRLTNEEALKLIEQTDPTGDERMTWAAKIVCCCCAGVLVLLLLSLLTGCTNNIDRALWNLLD